MPPCGATALEDRLPRAAVVHLAQYLGSGTLAQRGNRGASPSTNDVDNDGDDDGDDDGDNDGDDDGDNDNDNNDDGDDDGNNNKNK